MTQETKICLSIILLRVFCYKDLKETGICLCSRTFTPARFSIFLFNQLTFYLLFFVSWYFVFYQLIFEPPLTKNIEIWIQVGVLIEEPFPNLSLDESCKKLHDSIEDIMSVHNMVHRRIHAKLKDIDKREVIDGRVNIF